MTTSDSFDPPATAKRLLREARVAALATRMIDGGAPYASLVAVASAHSGAPLLLISELAVHTKNIAADPRVSLMIAERTEGDPLREPRVSVQGRAVRSDDPSVRRRYLAAQPDAAFFADFKDFGFYELAVERAHLVAGFGRIVDLTAQDVLTDLGGAEALLASEEGAVAHMNADHADACALYATRLLGAPEGDWRVTGCDPEGLDLQCGRIARRLPFPARVTTSKGLREMLVRLAGEARAASDRT